MFYESRKVHIIQTSVINTTKIHILFRMQEYRLVKFGSYRNLIIQPIVYSKAVVEMRSGIKTRKDCKDRIEGIESDARYIKKLEGVLSDYIEEELEVRKHKVNIKDEQMARLVCYHPSTEQMVNYRMHTTPDCKR